MSTYDEGQEVKLPDQEHLGKLLLQVANGLAGVTEKLNPNADDWDLESGQVGVVFVPSDPPSVACILEHPDTGHWMLQYPCGSIFIADLTTGQATF